MPKRSVIAGTMSAGMILVFLLGGCAFLDSFFDKDEEESPSELMADGTAHLEKGNYEAATEAFQKLKDRYPYSKYAIGAELKMADSLYQRKEFIQAYEAYDEFERLHPKNSDIPYVIYQKGMCHFRQVTTIDRDQSQALKAKEEFERLIRRFPRDDYANIARKNLRRCLVYLAEYELYVGHFYYKKGKYRAALERYSYIIENYPDLGQYHEALEYISKCKGKLAKKDN
jgi:outer membrane protein assembly factor BamD